MTQFTIIGIALVVVWVFGTYMAFNGKRETKAVHIG